MNNTEYPTPEFKIAIAELVLQDKLGRPPVLSPQTRSIVQAGLERAVVDLSSLRAYLGYLDEEHHVRHPFKYSELLTREKMDELLADGLGCLSNAELTELALNPLQLMDVSDEVEEQEVSDHWLPIIWRYNREAVLLAEVFDEHQSELDAIFLPGEAEKEVVRPSSATTTVFASTRPEFDARRAPSVSAAADSASAGWITRKSTSGVEFQIIRHPRPGMHTLRFPAMLLGQEFDLRVGGIEIIPVEPLDVDGDMVVQTDCIATVLSDSEALEIVPRPHRS